MSGYTRAAGLQSAVHVRWLHKQCCRQHCSAAVVATAAAATACITTQGLDQHEAEAAAVALQCSVRSAADDVRTPRGLANWLCFLLPRQQQECSNSCQYSLSSVLSVRAAPDLACCLPSYTSCPRCVNTPFQLLLSLLACVSQQPWHRSVCYSQHHHSKCSQLRPTSKARSACWHNGKAIKQ